MEEFKIEVEEILQRVVTVKAHSLQEAMEIVQRQYDKGEIVLHDNDVKEITVRKYND